MLIVIAFDITTVPKLVNSCKVLIMLKKKINLEVFFFKDNKGRTPGQHYRWKLYEDDCIMQHFDREPFGATLDLGSRTKKRRQKRPAFSF